MLSGGACVSGPARQAQHAVFFLPDIAKRLKRRRCRTEDNRDAFTMGAPDRQIAGMVAPAFLLFIGTVVFFIDHDHAKIFKRCK